MGQVMVDKMHLMPRLTEGANEVQFASAMALVLGKPDQQPLPPHGRIGPFAGEQQLEIMAVGLQRLGPAEGHMIHVLRLDPAVLQGGLNREHGKRGILFPAAKPLFRAGKGKLAVLHQAGGGLMH